MNASLELIFMLSFSPLFLLALIACLNALTFPRLRPPSAYPLQNPLPLPLLSVLIPMRNEAAVIAETVRSLRAQTYPNFEILIVDDQSTDNSAQIALQAAEGDSRLQVLTGQPLPRGWLGKAWACHQLSAQAQGEYLLFTDADVRWEPEALAALVAEAMKTQADLLTAWPRQETVTWGERLIVPLMAFSVFAYLPALAVHYIPWPVFAAAIGQGLLFKRTAYAQIGGHAILKNQIADDMACAYAVKKARLRFRMVEASRYLTCRMYQNWDEVRRGYAKNILAGHGNRLAFLLFSTVFHGWLFIVPWLWLVASLSGPSAFSLPNPLPVPFVLPGLLISLGLLTRALTASTTRQRLGDALLLPVSVALMTVIAIQSLQWHFSGGPEWKGRKLTTK